METTPQRVTVTAPGVLVILDVDADAVASAVEGEAHDELDRLRAYLAAHHRDDLDPDSQGPVDAAISLLREWADADVASLDRAVRHVSGVAYQGLGTAAAAVRIIDDLHGQVLRLTGRSDGLAHGRIPRGGAAQPSPSAWLPDRHRDVVNRLLRIVFGNRPRPADDVEALEHAVTELEHRARAGYPTLEVRASRGLVHQAMTVLGGPRDPLPIAFTVRVDETRDQPPTTSAL